MKKGHITALITITALFSVFLLGFFLGRRAGVSPVYISDGISNGPTLVTTAPTEPRETQESVSFPININSASASELTALPGIGEVLAERIVDHRTAHGEFTIIEEIMDVYGISEKKYNDIKDLITVGG